jgi:putative hydrolase of the HAD superfamily
MDLSNIKSIIFDLGNVLIDIDPSLTIDEIENLGGVSWNETENRAELENQIHLFEKGLITPLDFYKRTSELLELNISFEEFVEAWNKTLLDIPIERWNMIRRLSAWYNLYLLSNTNEIHIQTIFYKYKKRFRQDLLFEFMNKEYYSNCLGMRKPDKLIFEHVINDSKIKPEETLFVDDLKTNIISAAELGFQTYYLLPGEEISKIFTK